MTNPITRLVRRMLSRRNERRMTEAVHGLGLAPMPDCEEVAAVMQAFLDGELPDEAIPMVRHHLDHCERCGVEAEVHRQVRRSLAAMRQAPDQAAIGRLRSFAEGLLDA